MSTPFSTMTDKEVRLKLAEMRLLKAREDLEAAQYQFDETQRAVAGGNGMTPGQRVIRAFNVRGYVVAEVIDPGEYIKTDNSEIAGIIEQETGIVDLIKAVEKLLAVCKHDDILPHVCGHVKMVEEPIRKVSWADEL